VAEVAAGIEAGQLLNYYQPQVSFVDCALVGVEALVRWNHPEEGIVLPYRFVKVAEAGGLIVQLTNQVLRNAMLELRRWRRFNDGLRVSVNVTMSDLMDLEGPDRLAGCAAEYGVGLERLALEITESQLAQDWQNALDVAARLRLKGVGLSIDDYGTGYSSLKQLRDLPFDELKLDRSFIHGAADAAPLHSIVAAHVDMAHRLGIKVVAEGIEDERDWHFLRRLGCDLGQGFLIARPMPAGDLAAWHADWLRRCAEGGLLDDH
jgi:EAL domain-containing protein (putative c-di-GMP-specific phosphodiesterase class I)